MKGALRAIEDEVRLSAGGVFVILGHVVCAVGDLLVDLGCWVAGVERSDEDPYA